MAKRKYKCPHCKETSVLKENDVRICLTCGFQSMPSYVDDSETMKMLNKTSPKIVKSLLFYDDDLKRYWLPSILDVNRQGMVFPEGNQMEWKWAYAPYVPIPVFERINYPVQGKDGEYYEYRLGLDNIEYFEQNDFSSALKRLGVNYEE